MFLVNFHSMSGPFLSKAEGDETKDDVEDEAGKRQQNTHDQGQLVVWPSS